MKVLLCTLNAKFIHSSLALRYLRAVCAKVPDINISLREFTINEPLPAIMADIHLERPEVICFSCYIWNIRQIIELCHDYKQVAPNTTIILGGPEVSYDSAAFMHRYECIDFIVRGEGELTLPQLLEQIVHNKPVNEVKGLTYRNDGQVISTPEQPLITNLDDISFPYEGDISDLKNRTVYYETSRGCPFNCAYCLSSTINGVRYFSLDRVKKDLGFLIAHGTQEIKFVDRTFNCHEQRALEIMKFLVDNPGQTKYHFEICAELLSDNMMNFLSTVPPGIFEFEIGVQSTYEPALKAVNRKYDWQKLKQNVTKLRLYRNIHLHLDLIAGLPWETYSQFGESFNMVYSLQPDVIQLGFLKVLKGSKMRLMPEHGYKYQQQAPYQVLANRYISYSDIVKLMRIEDILSLYYNRERPQVSLDYLIKVIYKENPFLFYAEFSDYWEKNGLFKTGHKKEMLYSLLKDFVDTVHSKHAPLVNDLIKYDFLSNHKAYELPPGIERYNPEDNNDLLYSRLKDPSFLARYLSDMVDQSPSSIRKKINVEYFQYDPKTYAKMTNPVPKMFVYNPVSNKAVRIVDI
ncbi:MAG: DUF4080 domain-containing protein [Syntrophomonadaceae bacterium]|jgi:radical SAM superfamily enzyme YgiQ (UPF0313 family)